MSDAQYMMDNYTQDQCMGIWDDVDEWNSYEPTAEEIAYDELTKDMPPYVLNLKDNVNASVNCWDDTCSNWGNIF